MIRCFSPFGNVRAKNFQRGLPRRAKTDIIGARFSRPKEADYAAAFVCGCLCARCGVPLTYARRTLFIVLAAPFWELSFPAILKIYLERVSMRDITFGYEESGLVGRCRAEKLLLVTTRGGDYSLPETEWMEMGARQLKALRAMFGIPKFELLCAEGLDDERVDARSRMDEALARADALGKTF